MSLYLYKYCYKTNITHTMASRGLSSDLENNSRRNLHVSGFMHSFAALREMTRGLNVDREVKILSDAIGNYQDDDILSYIDEKREKYNSEHLQIEYLKLILEKKTDKPSLQRQRLLISLLIALQGFGLSVIEQARARGFKTKSFDKDMQQLKTSNVYILVSLVRDVDCTVELFNIVKSIKIFTESLPSIQDVGDDRPANDVLFNALMKTDAKNIEACALTIEVIRWFPEEKVSVTTFIRAIGKPVAKTIIKELKSKYPSVFSEIPDYYKDLAQKYITTHMSQQDVVSSSDLEAIIEYANQLLVRDVPVIDNNCSEIIASCIITLFRVNPSEDSKRKIGPAFVRIMAALGLKWDLLKLNEDSCDHVVEIILKFFRSPRYREVVETIHFSIMMNICYSLAICRKCSSNDVAYIMGLTPCRDAISNYDEQEFQDFVMKILTPHCDIIVLDPLLKDPKFVAISLSACTALLSKAVSCGCSWRIINAFAENSILSLAVKKDQYEFAKNRTQIQADEIRTELEDIKRRMVVRGLNMYIQGELPPDLFSNYNSIKETIKTQIENNVYGNQDNVKCQGENMLAPKALEKLFKLLTSVAPDNDFMEEHRNILAHTIKDMKAYEKDPFFYHFNDEQLVDRFLTRCVHQKYINVENLKGMCEIEAVRAGANRVYRHQDFSEYTVWGEILRIKDHEIGSKKLDALLRYSPVKSIYENGVSLLSLAIHQQHSVDVIEKIVLAFPDTVHVKNKEGQVPVLEATMPNYKSQHTAEIVKALLRYQNINLGRIPQLLEHAVKSMDNDLVVDVLKWDPASAAEKNSRGQYPWEVYQTVVGKLQENKDVLKTDDDKMKYIQGTSVVHLLQQAAELENLHYDGRCLNYTTVVHRALQDIKSTAHIKELLDKYPAAVGTPDADGRLPLHIAVTQNDVDSTQNAIHLIKVFPYGAYVKAPYAYGRTRLMSLPLHSALRAGAEYTIILGLLDAYPESVKLHDDTGDLPIDLVRFCIDYNKVFFQTKRVTVIDDTYNCTDLTSKAQKNTIVSSYTPFSVRLRESIDRNIFQGPRQLYSNMKYEVFVRPRLVYDRVVFHLTVHRRMYARMSSYITELSERFVKSVRSDDKDFLKITKLQRAIKSRMKAQAEFDNEEHRPKMRKALESTFAAPDAKDNFNFLNLVREFPGTATVPSVFGDMLLHVACESMQDDNVIAKLVRAYPTALCSRGNFGRLPLHIALKYNCSLQTAETLHNAYPAAVKVPDSDGHLPLWHAFDCIGQGRDASVAKFIYSKYKEALFDESNPRYQTPWFYCFHKNNADFVQMILENADTNLKDDIINLRDQDDHDVLWHMATSDLFVFELWHVYKKFCQQTKKENISIHSHGDVSQDFMFKHCVSVQGIPNIFLFSEIEAVSSEEKHVFFDGDRDKDLLSLKEMLLNVDENTNLTIFKRALRYILNRPVLSKPVKKDSNEGMHTLLRDYSNFQPLHEAAKNPKCPEIVHNILMQHFYTDDLPKAYTQKIMRRFVVEDESGNTVLQNAMMQCCPANQYLMRVFFDFEMKKKKIENLDIKSLRNLIVSENCLLFIEQIKKVASKSWFQTTSLYENTLSAVDTSQNVTLHYAAASREHLGSTLYEYELFRASINFQKIDPKHREKLCAQHLGTVNADGHLPLHYAARVPRKVRDMQELYQFAHNGPDILDKHLMITDLKGHIPLHHAAQSSNDVAMINFLTPNKDLSPNPAHGVVDNQGRTALFYAVGACPFDVVQVFIDYNTDAVNVKDSRDCLPLHYAVTVNADVRIVNALLQASPASVFETDNNKKTAGECAIENCTLEWSSNMHKTIIAIGNCARDQIRESVYRKYRRGDGNAQKLNSLLEYL